MTEKIKPAKRKIDNLEKMRKQGAVEREIPLLNPQGLLNYHERAAGVNLIS